jgi:uncharacterized membrane protein HdeD (DUF308 family)
LTTIKKIARVQEVRKIEGGVVMFKVSGWLMGVLSIIAGIAIILLPNLLAWIVGIYLIVIGILAILAVVKK